MAQREQLNDEQRRLLRIIARMPPGQRGQPGAHPGHGRGPGAADVGNPSRRRLGGIGGAGMTERRQHRWFLTRKAVDALYVTDHQHPSPREEARAAGLAEFHPEGELPADFTDRFALDHDHPAHLENQDSSPFAAESR